jgi:hypothetical protein
MTRCTRCTMSRGEREEGGPGPPWTAFKTHGPNPSVHHEPSARTRRPFETQTRDVAKPQLDTCPGRPGLDRPVSSPDPAHQGPVLARSGLTIDR